MAQQTKNQIKSYFEAGDRPNDLEFGHFFDSIVFINEANQGSNTDTTVLNGGLTLGGTLTLTGITDFKMGGNLLVGNLEEALTRPIQAYSSTNETIIFASGSVSDVMFEGVSTNATASIKLSDGYSTTAVATFGTHTGKAFMTVGGGEVFHVSASSAGYRSFFSGSVGIGKPSPSYTLDVKGEGRFGVNDGILLTDTGGTSFVKAVNNHLNLFTSRDQDDIFFTTGTTPTTKMFIQGNTGNVGIGTTGPGEKLQIEGTTGTTRAKVKTTTGNSIFRVESSVSDFSLIGRGDQDRFDIYDATSNATPFKVVGGGGVNNTLIIKEGKIGIGTDSPAEKLDIAGGNIVVDTGYGLGRFDPADSVYVFYPYLADANVPNTFVNITPSNGSTGGMSLQSDRTISFVESDSNILIGQMELNQKKFDWDGEINAHKVFANELHGDGSNITNIVGSQIIGFVNNPDDNRILTAVDNTGNAIRGESDLTFDGTDLKLDGNLAIGKGTAGLFTPDALLHIKHTGDSLGNSDLLHLQTQSTTTEGNISIKFSDEAAPANQHFKITFGEGSEDLKFHSDTDDNILYLEHDGNVGIGTSSPGSKLTVDGSIKSLEGSIGNLNTTEDKGQQMEFGTDAATTLRFDADRWRLYAGGSGGALEVFTVLEDGKIGIGTSTPDFFLDIDRSNGAEDLGGTEGDEIKLLRLSSDTTNSSQLLFTSLRTSNGSDWQTAGTRIQAKTDATWQGYVQFNGDGNNHGISFGGGSQTTSANDTAEFMRIESNGRVGIGTDNPNHRLEVHGTIAPYQDIDNNWITFKGPGTTRSTDGVALTVSAGIKRLTGQGGIGMFCDSYMVLHAGDHGHLLADTLAAFHNAGDGTPGDQSAEVIHLIADGDIEFRTQTQSGLTDASIHQYRMNNGHFIINGRDAVQDGNIKLTVHGGGIAIDSNDNGDYGFIHQGTNAAGIGLVGDATRLGDARMDLHVDGDGKVTIGNVSPTGAFTVKSRGTNQDMVNFVSAGTNATRILQFTDTSNGHGLIDFLENDGTHGARVYSAGTSFFKNNVGIGHDSTAERLDVLGKAVIRGGGENWNLTGAGDSPGTTRGTLHLDPEAGGNNKGPAITFGASDNDNGNSAQAGIYIRSDGGYGTRMYFAVTNEYAVGPKQRMVIHDDGNVGIGTNDNPGQKLTINGTSAQSWDRGLGFKMDGTSIAKIIPDTEGLKLRTFNSGDHFYFRNSDNITTLAIKHNGHVIVGGDDSGTNSNYPMGLTEGEIGAYLEVQNERGGDTEVALMGAWSANQGDGIVYVGQSTAYGGGIMYRGDATNPSELDNMPADNIGIFRQTGETTATSAEAETTGAGTHPVMTCPHWNSRVKFHDQIAIYTTPPAAVGAAGRPAITIKSKVQGALSSAEGNTGGGLRMIDNDSDGYWEIGNVNQNLYFSKGGGGSSDNFLKGYLDDTYVGEINFTGQHRSKPSVGSLDDYTDKVGQIVIADGTYDNFHDSLNETTPNINEALPKVVLSSQEKDKRVFGVISDKEDPNGNTRNYSSGIFKTAYPIEEGDHRLIINSLGEGAILVSNYNGNLENGDYITTSPITGIGMKQDDDLLHNYTVAKITQDEDFTSEPINVMLDGVNYKMKLVGCTYHCG